MINLMIDDWVFYEGKPIKVENVHKNCINFKPDIPYVQEEDCVYLTQIEPIPFTPEIMEKNRFKLNEEESESLSKMAKTKILAYDFPEILGCRFFIECHVDGKVAYLTDNTFIAIKYVNEFQHLLRLMERKAPEVKEIADNFIV